MNEDILFEEDGEWYFWDETWSTIVGPFPNEWIARQKLEEYIHDVLFAGSLEGVNEDDPREVR